ncbi:hypothetical protein RHSIM_Rhsim09G0037100 [Rhododendron simsii]|uniref:Protein kinase domain-containing protein n=1 Tax=Rhododendron simsii TaxID=118357 RepID=A0A834LEJ7_RHOSS|nr:hypothetical protein RHSIM_Rhsim09G0037100 [Rhododendron simsii]
MFTTSDSDNSTGKSEVRYDPLCRRFSLAEIQSVTNDFDDKSVIGTGGFGKVYKGFIDGGATAVAVKRLNSESKQGAEEFWVEVRMLSEVRHAHLVALIGYCNEGEEMILVYEYIANGALAHHLYKVGRRGADGNYAYSLTWEQSLHICIGAARGTAVKGTFGYLDPDYFLTQRLTKKSDVYAFGVVMLEVLCGRPAVDTTLEEEQISLVFWVKQCIQKGSLYHIIDPPLRGQISPGSLKRFVEVASNCLQDRPTGRPTMAEVAASLEYALALQRSGIVTENNDHCPVPTKKKHQHFCVINWISRSIQNEFRIGLPQANTSSYDAAMSSNREGTLYDWEEEQLQNLKNLLNNCGIRAVEGRADHLEWNGCASKIFSVKSMYKLGCSDVGSSTRRFARSQIRETALRMLWGLSLRDRTDLTRAASEKEPEASSNLWIMHSANSALTPLMYSCTVSSDKDAWIGIQWVAVPATLVALLTLME